MTEQNNYKNHFFGACWRNEKFKFHFLKIFTCLGTDYGVMKRFPVISRVKVLTGVELCLTAKVSKLLQCLIFHSEGG